MDNYVVFLLLAFFLYWLCQGIGLLFEDACVEIENKRLWRKILKDLEKELNSNA